MNGQPVRQPVRQIVVMMLSIALPACVDEQTARLDSVSAPAVIEPGRRRGIIECEEDHPCGTPPSSAIDDLSAPVSANDVTARIPALKERSGEEW